MTSRTEASVSAKTDPGPLSPIRNPPNATSTMSTPGRPSSARVPPQLTPEEKAERRKQHKAAMERLSKPLDHQAKAQAKEAANQSPTKKINAECEEKLVDRLYLQTIKQHEEKLLKKVNQYYQYEAPKRLSDEKITENAIRLTSYEQDRRKAAAEKLELKYYQVEPPKTLSRDVIDECTSRMYEASLKLHQEKQKRLEKKYAFQPVKGKKATDEEVAACASRLSAPKKSDFSDHPDFGATHGS